jgi:predicted peptidase
MIRKYFTLIIVMSLAISQGSMAQTDLFQRHIYKSAEFEMPYRLLIPENYDEYQKYPVILYFHGAGERGIDNEITLKNGVQNFASDENRKKYPCIIIVPQCPPAYRWVEVHWALPSHVRPTEMSLPMKHSMVLLDEIIELYSVDTNRIYVTGLSMGGFGTWDAITRFPNTFAAAIPVCGGADTAFASCVKNVPVWAFHGKLDKVVIPSRSIDMVDAIVKQGGKVARLTIYNNVAHNAWVNAYANQLMIDWMFAQTKQHFFYED